MSEYIHFSWHASTPPMGRRQEAGERSPTRQKISVFDKREQRPSLLAMPSGQLTTNRAQRRLAFYAEVRRKKTKSTDVWIYTNRTNKGETST